MKAARFGVCENTSACKLSSVSDASGFLSCLQAAALGCDADEKLKQLDVGDGDVIFHAPDEFVVNVGAQSLHIYGGGGSQMDRVVTQLSAHRIQFANERMEVTTIAPSVSDVFQIHGASPYVVAIQQRCEAVGGEIEDIFHNAIPAISALATSGTMHGRISPECVKMHSKIVYWPPDSVWGPRRLFPTDVYAGGPAESVREPECSPEAAVRAASLLLSAYGLMAGEVRPLPLAFVRLFLASVPNGQLSTVPFWRAVQSLLRDVRSPYTFDARAFVAATFPFPLP
jgi:hypothetical protein